MTPTNQAPSSLNLALARECESAAADLARPLESAHHTLRRRLKLLRAWLRLHPLADAETRRKENSLWKRHGLALAAGREQEALGQSVALLRGSFPDALPSAIWDRYEAALRAAPEPLAENRRRLLARDLRAAAERYQAWPEPEAGAVAGRFARSVKKAWKLARAARDEPGSEPCHELRKRIKDIVLQLRHHREETPGADFRLARKLKKVTDALGEARDLDALAAHVLRHPRRFPGEEHRTRLLDLAGKRARLLERKGVGKALKRLKKLRRKVLKGGSEWPVEDKPQGR